MNVNQFRNVCKSINEEKGHHLFCVEPTVAPMETAQRAVSVQVFVLLDYNSITSSHV